MANKTHRIIFHCVRYKNFFMAGNQFIEIPLDQHQTTLVYGANGHGKSSWVDALCFGLFDQPLRPKMPKAKMVNSTNMRECVVEVEFSIGTRQFMVRRGMKPNVFEIYEDGRMFDQDSRVADHQTYLEQNILKMSFKSFSQVVVLGSAVYKPFMQLGLPERRAIVEDLLDIQIFSAMNKVLKKRQDELKEDLVTLGNDYNLIGKQTEMLERFIADTRRNSQRKAEEERDRIRIAISENDGKAGELEGEIQAISATIEALAQQVTDQTVVEQRIKKLEQFETKLRENSRSHKLKLKFYQDNTKCDQCSREIPEADRQKEVTQAQEKLSQFKAAYDKLQAEMAERQGRLSEITKVNRQISDKNSAIAQRNGSLSSLRQYTKRLHNDLATVTDTVAAETANEEQQLVEFLGKQAELDKRRGEMIEDRHYLDIAHVLLKEGGIKTVVVRQYLPIINKLVNKYISALDFFASFALDEGFSESIRRRFLDETSYYALSEGQKKRVDLAILFAWREVAKLKNSVSTNVLVLDEVADSSLDDIGTENFLKLLAEVSDSSNVFVISPKGGPLQDKFHHSIHFVVEQNFSIVK